MSDTSFDVTYRVGLGNLNAFFGAWLKRTWFDRASRRRLLIYTAAIFALMTFALRSVATDRQMWNLGLGLDVLMGALMALALLLTCAVMAFVLTCLISPFLVYLAQAVTFAFGPMRKRTSHMTVTTVGIDKTTGGIESQAKWRDFTAVIVTRKTVLFFTNRNSATLVPKSAFASPAEAEAFAAFAQAQWAEARSIF